MSESLDALEAGLFSQEDDALADVELTEECERALLASDDEDDDERPSVFLPEDRKSASEAGRNEAVPTSSAAEEAADCPLPISQVDVPAEDPPVHQPTQSEREETNVPEISASPVNPTSSVSTVSPGKRLQIKRPKIVATVAPSSKDPPNDQGKEAPDNIGKTKGESEEEDEEEDDEEESGGGRRGKFRSERKSEGGESTTPPRTTSAVRRSGKGTAEIPESLDSVIVPSSSSSQAPSSRPPRALGRKRPLRPFSPRQSHPPYRQPSRFPPSSYSPIHPPPPCSIGGPPPPMPAPHPPPTLYAASTPVPFAPVSAPSVHINPKIFPQTTVGDLGPPPRPPPLALVDLSRPPPPLMQTTGSVVSRQGLGSIDSAGGPRPALVHSSAPAWGRRAEFQEVFPIAPSQKTTALAPEVPLKVTKVEVTQSLSPQVNLTPETSSNHGEVTTPAKGKSSLNPENGRSVFDPEYGRWVLNPENGTSEDLREKLLQKRRVSPKKEASPPPIEKASKPLTADEEYALKLERQKKLREEIFRKKEERRMALIRAKKGEEEDKGESTKKVSAAVEGRSREAEESPRREREAASPVRSRRYSPSPPRHHHSSSRRRSRSRSPPSWRYSRSSRSPSPHYRRRLSPPSTLGAYSVAPTAHASPALYTATTPIHTQPLISIHPVSVQAVPFMAPPPTYRPPPPAPLPHLNPHHPQPTAPSYIYGHGNIAKHLFRMALKETSSCPECGQGEETPEHHMPGLLQTRNEDFRKSNHPSR
ncbi:unnamed protein product [Cyprideis torosa]|uniref:Uncharacterized protein n=1 Tax=Cyprideis torosa TaxID=163714 RepID=A0A7R8WEQ4_9CRUS|nr:unnamed protein product [Cyprideis torosa]CAG0896045.1 unnamed protein product [Cyprideis torosa]